jgi:hypothetical protein
VRGFEFVIRSIKYWDQTPPTITSYCPACVCCRRRGTDRGYCGNSEELDDAVVKFALAYSRKTVQDHDPRGKARPSGRIRVATEQVVK